LRRNVYLGSIAEEDLHDLMWPDTRAGNSQMIGQEDDRAPDIEETDHVVVIGDAAASMRDEVRTSAAEHKKLSAQDEASRHGAKSGETNAGLILRSAYWRRSCVADTRVSKDGRESVPCSHPSRRIASRCSSG
jgi:hypothetical protein